MVKSTLLTFVVPINDTMKQMFELETVRVREREREMEYIYFGQQETTLWLISGVGATEDRGRES